MTAPQRNGGSPGPFPRDPIDAPGAAASVRAVPHAMIDKVLPLLPPGAQAALRRLAARWPSRPARAEPVVRLDHDPRPGPMTPLLPPAALNDNPLQGVHEAVEQDLRASGHLR
ncbi:hypothetical protein [Methylobacterium mesophilicum]|uniref:hypothetical protein n=1 Tax=Methylobacterium mesophilicum TaxID=39956 RepID=UPI001EE271D2|nr:hypothetical protein [Methylobacterium mesophilicum]GJE20447.1 hypothetical protein JHFBIEKO_0875 [Methylobacterium mesophilicum]